MGDDILWTLITIGTIVLVVWFYRHCARPALAYASAPRRAFQVCVALLAVVVACEIVVWIDGVVVSSGLNVRLVLSCVELVAFLILAAAFFRPRWFGALGSPDPTVEPRFLLAWFRHEWRRMDDDRRRAGFTEVFQGRLERIRRPTNEAFVDPWIASLQEFVHASRLGRPSSDRGRGILDDRLSRVVPVDPLARWI